MTVIHITMVTCVTVGKASTITRMDEDLLIHLFDL